MSGPVYKFVDTLFWIKIIDSDKTGNAWARIASEVFYISLWGNNHRSAVWSEVWSAPHGWPNAKAESGTRNKVDCLFIQIILFWNYISIFYLSFIIYIYDKHSILATGDRITLFLHRHLLFKIRFQIGPHPLQFPLCDKDENQKIESIELRLSEVNAESR